MRVCAVCEISFLSEKIIVSDNEAASNLTGRYKLKTIILKDFFVVE